MTSSIEDKSRVQIAEFLPDAIAKALNSYRIYMEKQSDDTPASFKEKHTACKTAIAHIELLLKLARWADLPERGSGDRNNDVILAVVLAEAEQELLSIENGSESAG